jgi:hypothetical protein
MADPSRYPDAGTGSDRESRSGLPRWVQIAAIIVAIVVLLVVVLVATGVHTPPVVH